MKTLCPTGVGNLVNVSVSDYGVGHFDDNHKYSCINKCENV